jgi:hypothetical protein
VDADNKCSGPSAAGVGKEGVRGRRSRGGNTEASRQPSISGVGVGESAGREADRIQASFAVSFAAIVEARIRILCSLCYTGRLFAPIRIRVWVRKNRAPVRLLFAAETRLRSSGVTIVPLATRLLAHDQPCRMFYYVLEASSEAFCNAALHSPSLWVLRMTMAGGSATSASARGSVAAS